MSVKTVLEDHIWEDPGIIASIFYNWTTYIGAPVVGLSLSDALEDENCVDLSKEDVIALAEVFGLKLVEEVE